jgi:carbon monoxide dehydrogenase subunit G
MALAALAVSLFFAGAGARAEEERPAFSILFLPPGEFDIRYEASLRFDAPPALVWRTITDYDRLADYLPGLDSSRVVGREGETVLVRQAGKTRVLFAKRYAFTLEMRERPIERIDFRMRRGTIEAYEGIWRILPDPDEDGAPASVVLYQVRLTTGMPVPGMLLRALVKREIGRMSEALAEEIARRRGG